ncbi:LPP20 family lipoprotein [Psychrilyobacter atlanticus]|uniref:LPP20 family lipoprotein n=1 Tax=Psychrilyobacter atlanticus TaxID=271091 RepID=UPI00042749AA|nr:LPP20 family lipoprotein [Psychrilyobacter atlanticus]
MKKLMILFLGVLMTITSFSKTLEGVGMGNSEVTAKKEALADLSNQIQVTIKSNFTSNKSLTNGQSNREVSSGISTISETNLLGVDFKVKKKWFRSKYTATATLDDTKISLYEKKANELRGLINSNYTQFSQTEDLNLKKNYLTSALKSYDEFDSYRNVAIILGSTKIYNLPYTKTQIKNDLQSVEKKINSDSLYNGVNILYVKSSGKFNDGSKEYFDNYFYSMLASISRENDDKVAVSSDNDSTVNTLVKVVLNSIHTSTKPAVYYNKKMITPESFVTTLNITVELYNKKKVENLLTITATGEGDDENSKEAAYEKAVKNGFEQMKEKLKKSLIK